MPLQATARVESARSPFLGELLDDEQVGLSRVAEELDEIRVVHAAADLNLVLIVLRLCVGWRTRGGYNTRAAVRRHGTRSALRACDIKRFVRAV